jgi:uncharacterized membrane protein YkoI
MRFLFAAALLSAGPALAEPVPGPLTIEDASHIARMTGMDEIREIELDDDVWEIEGRGRDGRKVELEIDAVTGDVIKAKRD